MNPYLEQQILNAEPVELTALVYQRAIGAVRDARESLGSGRLADFAKALDNAYAALTELVRSLRPGAAPELSTRLHHLYVYIQIRLISATLEQQDAPLNEVLGLLTTLAEAWAGVKDSMKPVQNNATFLSSGRMQGTERVEFALSA